MTDTPDRPRAVWWFGDDPPAEIAGQVAAHDAVKAAEQVVAEVADAEQHRAASRRHAAVQMLAELLLPRLEPHHVAAIVDDLEPLQVHNLTVLLRRAGWTIVHGRLHPPEGGSS